MEGETLSSAALNDGSKKDCVRGSLQVITGLHIMQMLLFLGSAKLSFSNDSVVSNSLKYNFPGGIHCFSASLICSL